MQTYYETIEEEAKDFVDEYKTELEETIKENKKKTPDYIFDEAIYQKWDLNDKLHEWQNSNWYGFLRSDWCEDCKTELSSAVKVLELSLEEETDTGLWEGQTPQEAIITMAFFTARIDLYSAVEKLIKEMIKQ